MKSLTARALVRFARRLFCFGLLLFPPAGSLAYWQAWTCLIVFFTSEFLVMRYLLINDPALLERRLKGGPTGEKRTSQKVIISLMTLCFVLILLVPAYDRRFGWSHVPVWLVICAQATIPLGFWIQFRTFRANTFASAIVTVVPNQQVISTGPYAVVRHPMYSGALVVNFCLPLALGSWWGWPFAVAMLGAIMLRLRDEEEMLHQSLPGYEEYCRKVQDRLIPHLW